MAKDIHVIEVKVISDRREAGTPLTPAGGGTATESPAKAQATEGQPTGGAGQTAAPAQSGTPAGGLPETTQITGTDIQRRLENMGVSSAKSVIDTMTGGLSGEVEGFLNTIPKIAKAIGGDSVALGSLAMTAAVYIGASALSAAKNGITGNISRIGARSGNNISQLGWQNAMAGMKLAAAYLSDPFGTAVNQAFAYEDYQRDIDRRNADARMQAAYLMIQTGEKGGSI